MVLTANESLLDAVTHRSVDLMRYSEHVRSQVNTMLLELQAELEQTIADNYDEVEALTASQQRRVEALLKQINDTIATTYSNVDQYTQGKLSDLATNEAEFSRRALDVSIPLDLPTVAVGAETLRALAEDATVLGVPLSSWWEKQSENCQVRFRSAVRSGMLRGDSTDDIVRAVRSSVSEDGAGLSLSRAQAATLVRSAVSTVANDARLETWKDNADLIKHLMWVSTLDDRTTIEFCIPRDHMLYDVQTLQPVGHGLPWKEGPGAIHPNCRSTSVPILRSAAELGLDPELDKLPPTTRASMDGQVPEQTTYEGWLKKQPTEVQDDVLGKARAQLWRDGRISSLRDLLDQKGRPLTIEDLQQRFPEKPVKLPPWVRKTAFGNVDTTSHTELIELGRKVAEARGVTAFSQTIEAAEAEVLAHRRTMWKLNEELRVWQTETRVNLVGTKENKAAWKRVREIEKESATLSDTVVKLRTQQRNATTDMIDSVLGSRPTDPSAPSMKFAVRVTNHPTTGAVERSWPRLDGKSMLQSDIAWFQELFRPLMPQMGYVKQDKFHPRANADPAHFDVNMGTSRTREVLWHEMGHIVEFQNPHLAEGMRAFRDSRATGPAQRLQDLVKHSSYEPHERALPGRYIDPYVGKVYREGHTEVLSMGVGYLASPAGFVRLYNEDKEYFHLIMGVLGLT